METARIEARTEEMAWIELEADQTTSDKASAGLEVWNWFLRLRVSKFGLDYDDLRNVLGASELVSGGVAAHFFHFFFSFLKTAGGAAENSGEQAEESISPISTEVRDSGTSEIGMFSSSEREVKFGIHTGEVIHRGTLQNLPPFSVLPGHSFLRN